MAKSDGGPQERHGTTGIMDDGGQLWPPDLVTGGAHSVPALW